MNVKRKNIHFFTKCFTCLIFMFALLLISLSGCRSSKGFVKKPSKHDMELIRQLVLEAPAFNTINSKMEFKIFPKEGVSVGMKGAMRIHRDSCLILSLQPFAGIEVLKCLIRPDSLFVLSRLHSVYSAESIDKLPYSELMPYYLLESILTNRIFIPGKPKPENEDIERFLSYKGKEGDYISLTQDSFNLSFHIDEDQQQYDQLRVGTENSLKAIEVKYSMFERIDAVIYPRLIEMSTERANKKLKIDLFFLDPSFDKTTDFKFVIPSKYKKVTLDELIKKFSDML